MTQTKNQELREEFFKTQTSNSNGTVEYFCPDAAATWNWIEQALKKQREEDEVEARQLLIDNYGLMPEPLEDSDSDWNKAVRIVDNLHGEFSFTKEQS